MKLLVAGLLLISSLYAGFFNEEESKEARAKKLENERLCKLFTDKAESYKKTMRDDELAIATLRSYEKRAEIYCSKLQ